MGFQFDRVRTVLPKLLAQPSIIVKDPKILADAILVLGLVAPLPHHIIVPAVMYAEYSQKGVPPEDRKILIAQESANQAIGFALHTAMFLLGGAVAHRIFSHFNPKAFTKGSRAMKDAETFSCLVGAFIGSTFIKPILSATFVKKEIKGMFPPTSQSQSQSSNSSQPNSLPMGTYAYASSFSTQPLVTPATNFSSGDALNSAPATRLQPAMPTFKASHFGSTQVASWS
jgi:hypothetical protein